MLPKYVTVSQFTQSLPDTEAKLKYTSRAYPSPHPTPRPPSQRTQNSHTHLVPGPRFPLGRAGHSVTRPAALRTATHAVLAVHRAVGTIVGWLEAAHGAELVAGTAAGFGAVLPFFCRPAEDGG